MKAHVLALTVAALSAAVIVPASRASAESAYEPLHARVSFDSGAGLVRGTVDDEWSYAPTNTIVLPGDTLWVDKTGTLELEMAGGSFLRLADGSKVEVVELTPNIVLRGWHGSFYVQRLRRSTGLVTLGTPACDVDVSVDGMVRVDVVGDGSTTVSVRWGEATVRSGSGAGDQVRVGQGRRVNVDVGMLPSTPVFFDWTAEDAFDVWNRDRARLLATGEDAARTPVKVSRTPIGMHDLAPYGEWVYIERVPYWRPTVVVDYVPYRVGHWSYVSGIGHTWVGRYPFCYVTSHYGRWRHHPTYGWVWTYREVWAPAWTATVRYGPHLVWAPLDPYDRPIVVGSATFRVGDVTFSIAASSYSPVDALYVGPVIAYPCTPAIITPAVSVTEIHIWNIYTGSRLRSTPVFRIPGLPVRDYSPRRVIRGPVVRSETAVYARSRVDTLESATGVREFRVAEGSRVPSVRTAMAPSARRAEVRPVSVATEARAPVETELRRMREMSPGTDNTATIARSLRSTRPSTDSDLPTRMGTGAASVEGGRNIRESGSRAASSYERLGQSAPDIGPSEPPTASEGSTLSRTPVTFGRVRTPIPSETPGRSVRAMPEPEAQPSQPDRTVRRIERTQPRLSVPPRPAEAAPPTERLERQGRYITRSDSGLDALRLGGSRYETRPSSPVQTPAPSVEAPSSSSGNTAGRTSVFVRPDRTPISGGAVQPVIPSAPSLRENRSSSRTSRFVPDAAQPALPAPSTSSRVTAPSATQRQSTFSPPLSAPSRPERSVAPSISMPSSPFVPSPAAPVITSPSPPVMSSPRSPTLPSPGGAGGGSATSRPGSTFMRAR